mmetsp:Transcript_13541/g.25417  ORF Transcript_13541/g.25417 Transcript_13541/m.25417 type:complete len:94 (-) Transcript_13541:997-1278(-)
MYARKVNAVCPLLATTWRKKHKPSRTRVEQHSDLTLLLPLSSSSSKTGSDVLVSESSENSFLDDDDDDDATNRSRSRGSTDYSMKKMLPLGDS